MPRESALFDSLRSDRLELILLPTEQCNFRCTYCYETFEHKKMKPPVVAGVKALIEHRAELLRDLTLGWFGGEPLLALDVIEDISRHAIETGRTRGFAVDGSITTNGYLLDPPRFRRCIDSRVTSFQISLDGPRELHDTSRVLASGVGTFDRIWENLLSIRETEDRFRILLRLHYTARNYREVGEFARRAGETFLGDERFQFMFHSVNRLGGANDDRIEIVPHAQKKEIEAFLWQACGRTPSEGGDDGYICYAAKANSLIVRSNGRLSKCTVALNDDFNTIGELREDGEIVADQKKFRRWIASVVEERWDDAACPLASVARAAASNRARAAA